MVKSPVSTKIEFCLLGPLMVRCDGATMPVPQGKQRALLAALLLDAGRVISVDELAEVLWGDCPPPSARATIQNHVMRLRKSLAPAADCRIGTQPRGYLMRVDAGELDVSEFEACLDAARAATRGGAWETAAAKARAGLSLWRGEALADVESETLEMRAVPRLAEMRLRALETRIDADLRLGCHSELVLELQQLVRIHPLREHLHGLLMLALCRDGRQAEALVAYQHARQILIDELGAEPGTRLRELHQQVLTADPALNPPGPATSVTDSAQPAVPRELPAQVPHFTGRTEELATLTGLLDSSGDQAPEAVVVSAIGGTAGVGKTALAVRWAHQVAGRFPDGQLYVNLRGYDPAQPMAAADALAGFLGALGVTGKDIPVEEDQRAARYRSLLAGRRVLVVLDNAGSVEQVRPLLPGTPGCAVVVTSRDALAGLVARDGAARLDLDLLPLAESVALLRELIGERAGADPDATAELAAHCARLPLALRVAAELAAASPNLPLTDLVADLAGQQQRLDLLEAAGDPYTAVRSVLSWSYRYLDPGAAGLFRLLGLSPCPEIDAYAAAALTATTAVQAARVLEALARAHLVQLAGPDRYTMHDLLRAYARDLATAQDSRDDQHAALTRLFDHYLHAAAAAMNVLVPAERHRRPRIPPGASQAPLADPAAAREWLDTERAGLVAVAVYAADHGWPGHATRLAAVLFRYLLAGAYMPEALTVHSHALMAARQAGDSGAEATALANLATVHTRQGRYQQAASHLQQALALFRRAGDLAGQARVHGSLGIIYAEQGYGKLAFRHQEQALSLGRRTGDRAGQSVALGNLGEVALRQGRCEQAARYQQQSLTLARETGNQHIESHALYSLGEVDLQRNRYSQATESLCQALALSRQTGNRTVETYALTCLGAADLGLGRHEQAIGHLQQALALTRETGFRSGEASALNGLGEVFLAASQPADALTRHEMALAIASLAGLKYESARACDGLGRALHAAGEDDRARRYWRQALDLYTELSLPEADQVRAQLATERNAADTGHPDVPIPSSDAGTAPRH
jgi:DNA-binding SARP family transcriptional activator/tetratricopeptide (TPR) repeat protein